MADWWLRLGDVSDDAVWRVYAQGTTLYLDRRQSWCVSTDPEFSRKASEIVGLYLNPRNCHRPKRR